MQLTFGDAEGMGKRKRKRTRKEIFLAEMEQVVPWNALLALIEPHYPEDRPPWPAAVLAGDDAADPLLTAAASERIDQMILSAGA